MDTSGTGTKILDLNYTYDGTGNVLAIYSESYSYDWLNRLTSANGSWGSIKLRLRCSRQHNNMTQGGTTTTYTYGSYNRLSSARSVTFSYDGSGNPIKEVNGSTTWNYYYDLENELIGVSKNGVSVQNSTYDENGMRVTKTKNSNTMLYLYQGLNTVFEKNLMSGVITKHFYANGIHVGKMVGSSAYYYQSDRLGSTRCVTDSSGSTIFSTNYQPFGLNYGASGSETFMFTGKPYDSSTGLYYYGARYYNPVISRFITEDQPTTCSCKNTTKSVQDNPLGLNRYIYVLDNPLRVVDTNGHDEQSITPTPIGQAPPSSAYEPMYELICLSIVVTIFLAVLIVLILLEQISYVLMIQS